jgi:hypothetical protein
MGVMRGILHLDDRTAAPDDDKAARSPAERRSTLSRLEVMAHLLLLVRGDDDVLAEKGTLLEGWRIIVTMPREEAESIADLLREVGGEPIVYPTVEFRPPPSWAPFDRALEAKHEWIVFTRPSSVHLATARAQEIGRETLLGTLRVAAADEETAEAAEASGLRVQMVPTVEEQFFKQEAAVFGALPPGTRVLFAQEIGGRAHLATYSPPGAGSWRWLPCRKFARWRNCRRCRPSTRRCSLARRRYRPSSLAGEQAACVRPEWS